LDVGCGEGYIAALASELMPSCQLTVSDISSSAVYKANDLFGFRACASNSMDIPFVDDSFDVVLCSEVIEHVAGPFRTIAELIRVARKFVLITTEASVPWPLFRQVCLKTREAPGELYDRNTWIAEDFSMMFGSRCCIYPQFYKLATSISEPEDIQRARSLVYGMSDVRKVSLKTTGMIILIAKREDALPPPQFSKDEKMMDLILEGPVNTCIKKSEDWDSEWVEKLLCPKCRNKSITIFNPNEVICGVCLNRYGRHNGVLDLLPSIVQDRGLDDELSAIRSLELIRGGKDGYLDNLAYAFEERDIKKNTFLYYFYRLLRGFFSFAVSIIISVQRLQAHDR